MNRRRFLAYLGIGAAGAAAGTELAPARGARRNPPSRASARPSAEEAPNPTWRGSERVVWSVDTDEPLASVSFDDGPDPELTPRILAILERFQVKATFMVMGYNAVRNPGLLQEVLDAGHEVGGHGWSHRNLTETRRDETWYEIEHGNRAIEDVTGLPVRVFRPPYGRFGEEAVRVLARSRPDLIVWSVTRGLLSWRDPRHISSHVISALGPGDIVDLHDGIGRGTFAPRGAPAQRIRRRREDEVRALPRILEGAQERGLGLVTISDLMAAWRPQTTS
jgi:peptidoglycan/xylan/chitin deacetylase (PgdA/CDA1 family)